jgi:hypothetical protein
MLIEKINNSDNILTVICPIMNDRYIGPVGFHRYPIEQYDWFHGRASRHAMPASFPSQPIFGCQHHPQLHTPSLRNTTV